MKTCHGLEKDRRLHLERGSRKQWCTYGEMSYGFSGGEMTPARPGKSSGDDAVLGGDWLQHVTFESTIGWIVLPVTKLRNGGRVSG